MMSCPTLNSNGTVQDFWAKPEKLFVLISLFFGFLLAFLTPIFTNFDEVEHFYKVYGLSSGTLNFKKITLSNDGFKQYEKPYTFCAQQVPLDLVQVAEQSRFLSPYFDEKGVSHNGAKLNALNYFAHIFDRTHLNPQTLIIYSNPGYTAVSYVLHIPVLAVLKLFGASAFFMVFLLRLCSLFLYTSLVYHAIKTIPFKKYLLLFVSIMPSVLYVCSGVNTDYLIIGLSFLFSARVLNYAFGEDNGQIGKREIFLLGALMFLICVSKFTYLPLILLYFVIPKEKFETQKLRLCGFFTILLACIGWVAGFLAYTVHTMDGVFSYYNERSASGSIAFLLSHPFSFVKSIFTSLKVNGFDYVLTAVSDFGLSETKLPASAVVFYIILLFLNAFGRPQKEVYMKTTAKVLFVFAVVLSLVLIFCSDFIIFPLEASGSISGFKGRYLIPVLPLFFLVFLNNRLCFEKLRLKNITLLYSLFFLLLFCAVIVSRYYIF